MSTIQFKARKLEAKQESELRKLQTFMLEARNVNSPLDHGRCLPKIYLNPEPESGFVVVVSVSYRVLV